jgi:glycosyltransferase involved in cell wall biosynthesis
MVAALQALGIPVMPVHMRPAPGQRRAAGLQTVSPAAAPFTVNLFYANGDDMRGFVREYGENFFAGRYSIGVWWSEIIPAPARWARSSRILDEIWVCSDHVRAALASVVEVPVLKMPQPVPLPVSTSQTRPEVGFPDGFVFHSMFDYASTIARKNPLGLVDAFRQAFAESSGAHLVIRSLNGGRHRRSRRLLEDAASDRHDIHVGDGYVAPGTKNAMLAHCDCYVSLHRAEGFGLLLAEAMRLARPTIATGWSGNLEFMTPANSYLVDYTMSRVGPGAWPYPADGQWADPDLEHAAAQMSEVFHNAASAAARGRIAAQDLRDRHDPVTVGLQVQRRLEQIHDGLGDGTV